MDTAGAAPLDQTENGPRNPTTSPKNKIGNPLTPHPPKPNEFMIMHAWL
jgi:hypothetical protein